MQKYFMTLLGLLLLSVLVFSPGTNGQPASRRAELEEKKLELEIHHLEEEARSNSLIFWSTIFGSLVGAATIIWTIYSGIRTMKQQIVQRRDERISSLMEKLSSESLSLRLGAVRGLSRYADDALPELLAAASNENSASVRGALEDTLTTVAAVSFDQVVSANSRSLPKRIHLMGRFSQLETEPEGAIFGFFNENVNKMLIQGFQVEYEHGQRLQMQRQKIPDFGKKEQDELQQIRQNLLRTAQITSGVMARWIRARRIFIWPDFGPDLCKANLFQSTLENLRCQYLLLTFAILRFSQFRNCEITDSDFSQSEMNESNFDKCGFYRCFFKETNLRKIQAPRCVFAECNLTDANFSEAELPRADFSKSDARQAKFNGTRLEGTLFNWSLLHGAQFKAANLSGSQLTGAEFYEADLEAAELKSASALNAKFNGADLSRASFTGADLQNVDFSGANLNRTNFSGAKLGGATFYKCKNYETAIFDVVPPHQTQ